MAESPGEARMRLGTQVMPAIETWLSDSESFIRLAHAALTGGPAALPAADPRGPATLTSLTQAGAHPPAISAPARPTH
ncbi:hypothetical protein [Streptomyces sp. NPDC051662]|uniref:hypothetical protein n=1 Tax=Streptomyces sp. NPDC051662 TaxID=3154750 RepID=UPI0034373676